MSARLKHRNIDDRFAAPLRPRRELFEALWNFALFKTRERRRKQHMPLQPLSRVNIWCQLRQAALVARYEAHMRYLGDPTTMSKRTLRRQLAAFQARGLVKITQDRHYDRRRGEWVMRPNVYAIQREGYLWIKKHGGAVQIPAVV